MNITEDDLKSEGFRRAGTVFPDRSRTLVVQIDRDLPGFVVSAMVVNREVKKFGTTGRKNSSFARRMHSTFHALRQVIGGPVPGRPPAHWRSRQLDPFKEHAPEVILAGQQIELWTTECPSFEVMMARETELNGRYVPEWTKEGRRYRRAQLANGNAGPEQ